MVKSPVSAVTANKILIVGPSWVGDMVMAQSLFISLKKQNPQVSIDVLAPAWSVPLLSRMPEIDEAILQPLGHGKLGLLTRYKIAKQVQRKHYDQAIVIPRSFKSALIPSFAGIPVRTGYQSELRSALLNDVRPLNRALLTQTVQRYVALGQSDTAHLPPTTPQPLLKVDAGNQQAVVQRLGLALDRPIVAFMPGAEYGPAKCWPAEYFAQVAEAMVAKGYQIWLLGSQKDHAVAERIKQDREHMHNLAGRTELVDTVDLLALAEHAVTNDSGLMHVAAAVNCPVLAIYGSSTPSYTPPLSDKAQVFYLGLECSPCFKRVCPYGHTRCLTEIRPQQVVDALLAKS